MEMEMCLGLTLWECYSAFSNLASDSLLVPREKWMDGCSLVIMVEGGGGRGDVKDSILPPPSSLLCLPRVNEFVASWLSGFGKLLPPGDEHKLSKGQARL